MKRTQLVLGSFHILSSKCCYLVISANVQHGTWLGPKPAAACGTGAERALWAMKRGGASGIARSAGTARLCELPGSQRSHGRTPGRVGRCRIPYEKNSACAGTVKDYAQIHIQLWQNKVRTGHSTLSFMSINKQQNKHHKPCTPRQ